MLGRVLGRVLVWRLLSRMLWMMLERVLGVLALMLGKSKPCSCASFFANRLKKADKPF